MSAKGDIPLRLIQPPPRGTREVVRRIPGECRPLFSGEGDANFLCGNCDQELARGVDREQYSCVVFVCPRCGYFNDAE